MSDEPLETLLETMRRGVNLKLKNDGTWWQNGQRFRHPHIIRAFNRGLDLHEDSQEAIVRIGDKWAYVQCEGTPFIVLTIEFLHEGRLVARINNEKLWDIHKDALFEKAETVYTYCRVHGPPPRHARFSRHAQAQLSPYLVETAQGYALRHGDQVWPISQDRA